jgi:hypothetical protein
MAYNLAERLRPLKVNAMLTNLSHLHARLRSTSKHNNDGRMLAVGLNRLAAEASGNFFNRFMHRPRTCPRL